VICNLRRQRQWHPGIASAVRIDASAESRSSRGMQQIMTTAATSPLLTQWFDARRATMDSAGSVTRSVREPLYDLGQNPRLGTGTSAAVRRAMCQ
jgi:hypothetical protein